MTLTHTPTASLAQWRCSEEQHDDNDRLLVHTNWNELLVVKPHCESGHGGGSFILDPDFMPLDLRRTLERELPYTTVVHGLPSVFVLDGNTAYGGRFTLRLITGTEDRSMKFESGASIARIKATTTQELGKLPPLSTEAPSISTPRNVRGYGKCSRPLPGRASRCPLPRGVGILPLVVQYIT